MFLLFKVCTLKIGSWSYDGYAVDIRHKDLGADKNHLEVVERGIDLENYYKSTEWDLLAVPAKKSEKYYTCCAEPFPDIKFNITIRRKTLFYTVNLILPCVAICSVTLLVFYIPANSGEKITMGITILNSLNIFLLLVAEINPPTSIATPLIGKYLLFTMVLVTCSITVTVFVLNMHFRSPSTHVMSPWIRELFLKVLPRLLLMRRPNTPRERTAHVAVRTCDGVEIRDQYTAANSRSDRFYQRRDSPKMNYCNYIPSTASAGFGSNDDMLHNDASSNPLLRRLDTMLPPRVLQAMVGVSFIADHMKAQDETNKVSPCPCANTILCEIL